MGFARTSQHVCFAVYFTLLRQEVIIRHRTVHTERCEPLRISAPGLEAPEPGLQLHQVHPFDFSRQLGLMALQRLSFVGKLLADVHIGLRLVIDAGIGVRHKDNRDLFDRRRVRLHRVQRKRDQTVGNHLCRNTVLLLTAKSEVEDKVRGLDTGANDYLTKPFATAELLARLRAMTRNQAAQTGSRLSFGNVTLDKATFELSSPHGSFRLANKEYQMIELLMRNPGQVIPTERFLEKIWGYDSDVEVNVVWVYISYLRKKLAALHADIQIKATRNTGYSLEALK